MQTTQLHLIALNGYVEARTSPSELACAVKNCYGTEFLKGIVVGMCIIVAYKNWA